MKISLILKPLILRLGLIVVVLSVPFLLWKCPEWQVARSTGLTSANQFDRENEARKTLAQIVGGLFLIAGLYLTWKNLLETEKSVRIASEGQITDRFTKAIAQLGDTKLEVRLGGIYALERIARDSPRDHWPIMEVLTAYVRDVEHEPAVQKEEAKEQRVTPDVQAILTVIGRRTLTYGKGGEEQNLDLHNTNLTGAILTKANLDGANLDGAILTKANLDGASLDGAILTKANLDGASLDGAFLIKVDLTEANLNRANLHSACLNNAYLFRAELNEVNLIDAVLRGALLDGAVLNGDLLRADLTEARLTEANLTKALLHEAHLTGANLCKANLTKALLFDAHLERAEFGTADLTEAVLNNAHLNRANLYRTNLTGAVLIGAHLERANLTEAVLNDAHLYEAVLNGTVLSTAKGLRQEQIDLAFGDAATKLPKGLQRPKHWVQGRTSEPDA